MIGLTIIGYRIKHHLGSGGMADVYYGENTLGKPAAIKVLHPVYAIQKEVVERFELEARIIVSLDHPNIRKVHDFGQLEGRPAIIMEYMEGHTLSEALTNKLLDPSILPDLFSQALTGLQYAHQKGIVHRDIKPSNLFLTKGGQLKILDFGIAKVEEASSHTLTGQSLGTILYMSPEQVQDPKRVDYRTDIYSLGVTFYHLVTGKPPYDISTDSTFKIQSKIVSGELDFAKLSNEWYDKLSNCLIKNPDQRLSKLSLYSDETISTTVLFKKEPYFNTIKTPSKFLNPNRFLYFLVVILLVITLISFGIILQRRSESRAVVNNIPVTILDLENNMIKVKGGAFQMGCTSEQDSCRADEYPSHLASVNSFYIGKYEVTQEQWHAVMGRYSSSYSDNDGCLKCPVANVNWFDINNFIMKLNLILHKKFRLPSETEWEFAARGGKRSANFKYSGSNTISTVAWYDELPDYKLHPIGEKEPNELGLFDMSGNVFEWVKDCWTESYEINSITESDNKMEDCLKAVVRGGGLGTGKNACRVSNRAKSDRLDSFSNVGFRLARD